MVNQGDIINISEINFPVIVISKDTYNALGHVLVCPIMTQAIKSPFDYEISLSTVKGHIWLDQIKNIDLGARNPFVIDHLPLVDLLQVLDRIQALFDYI